MKIYTYIGLLVGLFLMSSCTKDDNDCIPYISNSFSTADFPFFETDETTSIVGHRQEGNCLVLDTRFSGGCEDHLLQLVIDESSQSSVNISGALPALLSHNNTDQCEALVSLEVYVDISRLELLELEVVELSIEKYNHIVELVF